ncbi:MAG: YqaA family protein [Cytophagales bacterium]|nr:YqaA family protein [Cytophagales bacterium]
MYTIPSWIAALLQWLSIPTHSLTSVGLVAFLSATVLPLPAEPLIIATLGKHPEMFGELIAVATFGNTVGSMVTWWMGFELKQITTKLQTSRAHQRALDWLTQLGPKACFFSWIPFVGDPLIVLAGWMKLPFWPCVGYMVIGKGLRYLVYTGGFVWLVR